MAYGPLTNQTDAYNASVNNTGGWVNVQNDLQPMATSIRTPMISYLSPLQLANVLFASNISSLVGTLGTQSDTAVNILGGTIDGTVIGGTTRAAGNFNGVTAYTLPSIGQYNAVSGTGSTWYNSGFRNDGSAVYLLSSNVQTTVAAAAAATFNAYRPFSWNLSTGSVSIDGTGIGTGLQWTQPIDHNYNYYNLETVIAFKRSVTVTKGTVTFCAVPLYDPELAEKQS
jgi:hypothetical protein